MERGWKKFERRCARAMGTERIPVTGERLGADARTPMFCLQMKLRNTIPSWLFTWLDGICRTAAKTDQIGVLILKAPKMHDDNALVVLKWRDWVALHGAEQTDQNLG